MKEKAASSGIDGVAALVSTTDSNPAYTEEERRRFREDPSHLRAYRKEIEHENNARFAVSTRRDSPAAEQAIPMLTKIMKQRLAAKPELCDVLIPEWNVGCRRCELCCTYCPCALTFLISNSRRRLSRSAVLFERGRRHVAHQPHH